MQCGYYSLGLNKTEQILATGFKVFYEEAFKLNLQMPEGEMSNLKEDRLHNVVEEQIRYPTRRALISEILFVS